MADRLLAPSKITAWLDCAHFLTLKHEVEAGNRTAERSPFGEVAQMMLDKGFEHERVVLARYRAAGLSVFERDTAKGEAYLGDFAHWPAERFPGVPDDQRDAEHRSNFYCLPHPSAPFERSHRFPAPQNAAGASATVAAEWTDIDGIRWHGISGSDPERLTT